VAVIFII